MCGIVGFTGLEDKKLLKAMTDIIQTRGPDDVAYLSSKEVSFGMRRLSIIDLKKGLYPLTDANNELFLIFNGEIYNYPELRAELESKKEFNNLKKNERNKKENKKYRFKTYCDAECIVHGYTEYGAEIFSKLNGMFAIALWDTKKKKLFLARDYAGIKPLHYTFVSDKKGENTSLVFGSEIKSLLLFPEVARKINMQSMHHLLNLRFTPGEQTLFQGIKRIPAGHYMEVDLSQLNREKLKKIDYKLVQYWDLPNETVKETEQYYIEFIRKNLQNSIKSQLMSDVPLGAYLSGGLDSSANVALMTEFSKESGEKVKTFTMGFNEPSDEFKDAKLVAEKFGTEHHEIVVDFKPLDFLGEATYYCDEPKINNIQSYLLAQFVRKHVKVALSGMGGDELFAGYEINKFIAPASSLHNMFSAAGIKGFKALDKTVFEIQHKTGKLHWDEYRRGIQTLLTLGDKTKHYLILRNVWDYDNKNWNTVYSKEFLEKDFEGKKKHTLRQGIKPTKELFEPYFADKHKNILEQALQAEFKIKMADDFLLNEDRMSMAHSLEVRVPFLDKHLIEFAFSIPASIKMRRNETKYIYKKAVKDILPQEILNKKKWGFAINPYYQFQKDLKDVCEHVLSKENIKDIGIFNYDYIRKILDYKPHPNLRWHYRYLWTLLGFKVWHDQFIAPEEFKGLQKKDFILSKYY